MKKTFFLLSGLLFLSCGEKQPEQTENPEDSLRISKAIEVETNREVRLLPEAQDQVNEWLAFATAYNEVEDLRTATGKEIIENSQPLLQIMEALENSLPDTLQQVPVKARTAVLLTKANVLRQAATKKEIKADEVFKAANDLIIEFDNFKLQLNELFLKTPEDFEVELDRQFRENQDSLRRVPEPVRTRNPVVPK